MSYTCTASGSGYTGSGTMATTNGFSFAVAQASWVGYPSTCVWTAIGPRGSKTFTETLVTVADTGQAVAEPSKPLPWPREITTYFHNDVAGTPLLATDAAGEVLWKEHYRPYGTKLTASLASAGNKVGYAGKPYDNNTGLSYLGARYSDPLLGRFAGIDPKEVNPEDLHSFNRYAYANNNPYRYIDPNGMWAEDVVLAVPGIILGSHSLAQNIREGNWGPAAVDIGGLITDTVAAALPGVPGGAGLAIAATRNVSKGVEAAAVAKSARAVAKPVYKTTKEAKQAAEALGFKKINETVHDGQAVFQRGKDFITRDLDGHNGGAWKMADSVKALGSKETRAGTFDANLNRIGD